MTYDKPSIHNFELTNTYTKQNCKLPVLNGTFYGINGSNYIGMKVLPNFL